MQNALKIAAIAAAMALAGCGGGGGDDPVSSVEGIWGGTATNGNDVALIVLPSGETWGLYGNDSTTAFQAGILTGQLNVNGNSLVAGSARDINLLTSSTSDLTLSGDFASRQWLNLRANGSSLVNMRYDSSYNTAVSLSQVAGSYTAGVAMGNGGVDDSVRLNVSTTGQLTSSSVNAPQCTGSGTVRTRDTSKSVLDFSITFSGTGCLFPAGTTISGVTQYSPVDRELFAMGANTAKNIGLLLVAER